jgi:hypothetical protein
MLELQGSRFCRSIETFELRTSTFAVEYDASLNGLGIVLYKLDEDTSEPTLWKVAGITTSFQVIQDSSYQNAMEFIAVVMAIAILVKLGVRGATIEITGDNTSSLTWAHSERFKGVRSQRAAIVYIALGMSFDIEVGGATHVAGIDNNLCDRLSRGVDPRQAGFLDDTIITLHQDDVLTEILLMCDPVEVLTNEAELIILWKHLNSILSQI